MRPRIAYPASLFLVVLGAACERDRADEPQPAVATADAAAPEASMRATLQEFVRAQAAYHADHGRYADSTHILVDRYGFTPTGETTVTVAFQGIQPEWGYLAVAQHPGTDGRCEVQHTREMTEQRQIVGQVVCTGV